MNINFPSGQSGQSIKLVGAVYINGVKQSYTTPITDADIVVDVGGVDWIETNKRTVGNELFLDVLVDENKSILERATIIKISWPSKYAYVEMTAIQAAAAPTISLNPEIQTGIPYTGQTFVVEVTSNVDWTSSIEGVGFNINKTSGSGNETISVTVTSSSVPNERTGVLTIKSLNASPEITKIGTYRQDPCPKVQLSPESFVDVIADRHTETVHWSSSLPWTLKSKPDWVESVSPASGTSGQGDITITISKNRKGKRNGNVVLRCASGDTELPISQIAAQYTITINNTVAGGECSGTSGKYPYGTTFVITASPADHYHWVKWNTGETTPSITVTVGEGDATYTPIFEKDKHTITVATTFDDTRGKVDGFGTWILDASVTPSVHKTSLTVDWGTVVQLGADESNSHRFEKWEDGSSVSARQVTVNGDMTCTGHFIYKNYDVTVSVESSSDSWGIVKLDGETSPLTKSIAWGLSVQVEGVANTDYHFQGWMDTTDKTNPRTVEIKESKNIYAKFAPDTYLEIDKPTGVSFLANGNPSAAGMENITVNSNVSWSIDATALPTGWSVSPASHTFTPGGSEHTTVTITGKKTDETTDKTYNVIINSVGATPSLDPVTLSVSQTKNELDNISFTTCGFTTNADKDGGEYTPTIAYDIAYTNGDVNHTGATILVTMPSPITGCTLLDSSTGKIKWAKNEDADQRTAAFHVKATFGGKSVETDYTSTQNAPGLSFDISPVSKEFEAVGGTQTITVTTNSNVKWTPSVSGVGFSIDSTSEHTGPGSVTLSVTENNGGSSRTGVVTFSGTRFTAVTFNATQKVKVHTVSISVSSAVTENGGAVTLEGNATVLSKQYDHLSTASLVAIPEPYTSWGFDGWYDGTGTKVSSSASYSPTVESDITLTAKFIYEPTFSLVSSSNIGATAAGVLDNPTITIDTNVEWRATKSQSWFNIDNTSGSGSTINVTTNTSSPNPNESSRSMTITIECNDSRVKASKKPADIVVTINQDADTVSSFNAISLVYNAAEKTGGDIPAQLSYQMNWVSGRTTSSGATVSYSKVSGDADLNTSTGTITWSGYGGTDPRETVVKVSLNYGTTSDSATATARQSGKDIYTITISYDPTMCSATNKTVIEGNDVEIGVTLKPGYKFVKWNDGNTSNPRTLTNVTASATYTATCDYIEYTINVATIPTIGTGMGWVDKSPIKGYYHYGDNVNIAATNGAGWTFTSWSDGGAQSHNITVTSSATYTATFTVNKHPIIVEELTPAGGTGGTVSGGGTYDYGSSVQISATPNSGYVFKEWDDHATDNPRNITVVGDKTYKAIFYKTPTITSITLS